MKIVEEEKVYDEHGRRKYLTCNDADVKNCEECGQEFVAKRSWSKFCERACQGRAARRRSPDVPKRGQKRTGTQVCGHPKCSNTFPARGSKAYCSKECRQLVANSSDLRIQRTMLGGLIDDVADTVLAHEDAIGRSFMDKITSPMQRLQAAVLERAVMDWNSTQETLKCDAYDWLASTDDTHPMAACVVFDSLGLNRQAVLKALKVYI